jgi:hypothetical protein
MDKTFSRREALKLLLGAGLIAGTTSIPLVNKDKPKPIEMTFKITAKGDKSNGR